MSSDHSYRHSRTIIPVSVNPRDDQRFIRFRSSDNQVNDIQNRMSTSMREFEEKCRQWREKFFNESRIGGDPFGSSSLMHSKPRMNFDFPDFPEFSSTDWPPLRGPSTSLANQDQRAFIEEDNDGRKRYKIQFDIGDFRPEDLNVRVEGRMLIVTGDRQIKSGNTNESRQFNREVTLPDFIDSKSLQSYLSENGSLTMEAPVLMDRFYQDNHASALTSSRPYRSASPGRALDNTFSTGTRHFSPSSNFGAPNTNQSSSFSSSSTYRKESTTNNNNGTTGLSTSSSFIRNSPIRDQFSTSSSSTLIGGHSSNLNSPAPVTHSTGFTSRSNFSTLGGQDGMKTVTYEFDLRDFAPEDIAIQVNDTTLKVSALSQERSENSSSHREFKREIGLPEGAEAKQLTNALSSDGILTIKIPVRDYRPPISPSIQATTLPSPALATSPNDSFSVSDQQFRLTFDLSGYKPDDVTVKVNNNVLKVQAVHNENNYGNQINREYMREYVLPDWVDANYLRAKMSENSTLTVEAPIPQDRMSSMNRQIKITH